MYFCYFVIFPLGKGRGPSFDEIWIPFTQGCFVSSLDEIGPMVIEKKIFKYLSMYFCYFVIISSWKRAGPFIWTNLNPFFPRMLCAKFDWTWPSGSGEKMKMWKVYDNNTDNDAIDDNDGQRTIFDQKSSLTWAQVSKNNF